ncbi:hypothetical protein [Phytoactinopolyspora endophytica]|uniref:NHL domain-containing protein n=1 Tax=Phytoactinopolyspora endophytica TaxID=1642495 RepID=UPI0013EB5379|nr:hypothetical protein [Phytoactinopolyspora endophytica]
MFRAVLLTLSLLCTTISIGGGVSGAVASAPARAGTAAVSPVEPGPLETVAGSGERGYEWGLDGDDEGGLATEAKLGEVSDVEVDHAGNLYIATASFYSTNGTSVHRVAPDGTISRVAGGRPSEAGVSHWDLTPDGLGRVSGVAVGPDGELYVADDRANQVVRVDPGGESTVVAGTREDGNAGDVGPATSAQLESPKDVAVGNSGELYVVDAGYIRRIDTDGIITTIAGTGLGEPSSGDGGPAVEATFTRPWDIEIDAAGNIYVNDLTWRNEDNEIPSHRIRRIDTDGIITTIAGGETCGHTGGGGPAADAELCDPSEIAVAADGTIYLDDPEYHQIRVISPDGTINRLPTYVHDLAALAIGPDGALYVGDGTLRQVHRIPLGEPGAAPDGRDTSAVAPDLWADADPHVATGVAGTGTDGSFGDGGPATDAQLSSASDLAVGPDGTVYVLDHDNDGWHWVRVRTIDPDGTITTVAGGGDQRGDSREPGPTWGDGQLATEQALGNVRGIDVAPDGTLFMADRGLRRVRSVSPAGLVSTVAGTGEIPEAGDVPWSGVAATHMVLGSPEDVAVAPDGSLYVSDSQRHQVFHIGRDGEVQVAAGIGTAGSSGDDGPATEAELDTPSDIDVGADGTLYIADGGNRIRAVGPDGVITTFAADVSLRGIRGLAVDDSGTVYSSEVGSIRKIGTDGTVTTIIDSRDLPFVLAADGVAFDGTGNLYFSQEHQVFVLPRVDEEVIPEEAEEEATGTPWPWAIIGVLVAAAGVAGYVLIRRRPGRFG